MFYVVPGATDQTIYFVLRDSGNFLAKTELAYNSAGASCTYTRKRGTATTITLATLAAAWRPHWMAVRG